jgi:two-component system, OmpR family, sensor histidine kinase KdpD
VGQITGVRQRETLPDKVFDEANDIELIDLPPEDLLGQAAGGRSSSRIGPLIWPWRNG